MSNTNRTVPLTLVYMELTKIYFYFLHMNEEHLNIQQWNSKTQNTYNKHL